MTTTTLEKFAGAKRHNYCTLPTLDVEVLDQPRLCSGVPHLGIHCDLEVAFDKSAGSYGWGAWVHANVPAGEDNSTHHADETGRVLKSVQPRLQCSYCGTQDPAEVTFVQASWSDETRCTRCGGVDGRAIGD